MKKRSHHWYEIRLISNINFLEGKIRFYSIWAETFVWFITYFLHLISFPGKRFTMYKMLGSSFSVSNRSLVGVNILTGQYLWIIKPIALLANYVPLTSQPTILTQIPSFGINNNELKYFYSFFQNIDHIFVNGIWQRASRYRTPVYTSYSVKQYKIKIKTTSTDHRQYYVIRHDVISMV